MLRYIILGLLRHGRPQHGYGLAKIYRQRSGIEINTGSFYRELQRLADEGLVRLAANPPGVDNRRTPYQIANAGAAVFDDWLINPPNAKESIREDEISARAAFLAEGDPELVEDIIRRWDDQLWVQGKVLERARDTAKVEAGRGRGRAFEALSLLLARRLKYIAADLEFLDDFRNLTQGSSAPQSKSARSEESDRAEMVAESITKPAVAMFRGRARPPLSRR